MKYVYPVVFYDDVNSVGVNVVDLPGCHTFGDDIAHALLEAKEVIELWLYHAENENKPIPTPSALENIQLKQYESLTLVAADTDAYRKANDVRAVKKVISIPSWLNYQAERVNAPFAQILKQGLMDYLQDGK